MKHHSDILAAIEAHRDLYLHGALPMWTVTRSLRDMPGKAVARLWIIRDGAHAPTNTFVARDTLPALHKALREPLGLAVIPRDPADDPVIVESWI